jgi:hypothetical protein
MDSKFTIEFDRNFTRNMYAEGKNDVREDNKPGVGRVYVK